MDYGQDCCLYQGALGKEGMMGFLPSSIQIQTIDYCNRVCSWCPNSNMKKSPDRLMTLGLLERVLQNLKDLNYIGALHPYMMAEPFIDKRIFDIIKMIREMFPTNWILLSTNGDNLSEKKVDLAFEMGINSLVMSDYDNKVPPWTIASSKKHRGFVSVSMRDLARTFYNRAGHVNVSCEQPVRSCEWLHHKGYINYEGKVLQCCSDYEYKYPLGDLNEERFEDVWTGSGYRKLRGMHFQGRGKVFPLCKNCNRIGG